MGAGSQRCTGERKYKNDANKTNFLNSKKTKNELD
jgi:hypothetical protein